MHYLEPEVNVLSGSECVILFIVQWEVSKQIRGYMSHHVWVSHLDIAIHCMQVVALKPIQLNEHLWMQV